MRCLHHCSLPRVSALGPRTRPSSSRHGSWRAQATTTSRRCHAVTPVEAPCAELVAGGVFRASDEFRFVSRRCSDAMTPHRSVHATCRLPLYMCMYKCNSFHLPNAARVFGVQTSIATGHRRRWTPRTTSLLEIVYILLDSYSNGPVIGLVRRGRGLVITAVPLTFS